MAEVKSEIQESNNLAGKIRSVSFLWPQLNLIQSVSTAALIIEHGLDAVWEVMTGIEYQASNVVAMQNAHNSMGFSPRKIVERSIALSKENYQTEITQADLDYYEHLLTQSEEIMQIGIINSTNSTFVSAALDMSLRTVNGRRNISISIVPKVEGGYRFFTGRWDTKQIFIEELEDYAALKDLFYEQTKGKEGLLAERKVSVDKFFDVTKSLPKIAEFFNKKYYGSSKRFEWYDTVEASEIAKIVYENIYTKIAYNNCAGIELSIEDLKELYRNSK